MKQNDKNIISTSAYEKLGIQIGDPISDIHREVIKRLCEFMDAKFNISNECKDCVGIIDAVECMLEKCENLTVDDIGVGNLNVEGIMKGISSAGLPFVGATVPIVISENKGGHSLGINYTSITRGLADGCAFSNARTIVKGRDGLKRSITLRDTDSENTVTPVDPGRFPISISTDLVFRTDEGPIVLRGHAQMSSCRGRSIMRFDVNDYTSKSKNISLSGLLENISADISSIRNENAFYDTLSIEGSEYVNAATGIHNSINSLLAGLEEVCKRVEDLERDLTLIKTESKDGNC